MDLFRSHSQPVPPVPPPKFSRWQTAKTSVKAKFSRHTNTGITFGLIKNYELHQGMQRVVGPVTPVPLTSVLPGPVVFNVNGSSASIHQVDERTVKVRAVAGQFGDTVVTVSAGHVNDKITFHVASGGTIANKVGVPVSEEQPIS